MSGLDLNAVWFVLLSVFLAGYAVLDGFDLGVGILHPFVARRDLERRIAINSIGPVWDGNEVWLVAFGASLFAAFPEAYAAALSGFYAAFMMLLFALILRAVSIEFRSKLDSAVWKSFWDWGFFSGSTLATLILGVAAGNVLMGVPLDARGDFGGTFLGLLNPFSLLVGATAISLFALHGSVYLHLKTEGEFQERVRGSIRIAHLAFLSLYAATTAFAFFAVPAARANIERYPFAAAIPILGALAALNVPRSIRSGRPKIAFLSSAVTIVALVALFAFALFPNLLASSTPEAGPSLTIYNAASSRKTLGIMLLVAAIGMPCALAYTALVYRTFRGKVRLEDESY